MMKYFKRLLTAVLVLSLLCTSSALAIDQLIFEYAFASEGILYTVVSTDYTNPEDLNFSAKTENGDIKVESAATLRSEGTTWFVVLDYDTDATWTTEAILKTERTILQQLSKNIEDFDKGALVMASKTPQINIQNADRFRNSLQSTPPSSDTEQLGYTLKCVMDYIKENESILVPQNVAIVIVASALVKNGEMIDGDGIDSIKALISKNLYIPTHVICTVASTQIVSDNSENSWRRRANRMANYAKDTVGGSGYVTQELTDNEAIKAVSEAMDTQRRLVRLALNPKSAAKVGKQLTVTQTNAEGVPLLEATWDLTRNSHAAYDAWTKFWNENPNIEIIVPATPKIDVSTLTIYNDNSIDLNQNKGEQKISPELIIGIVIGLVILALAVVLFIVLKGRKPKNNPSVPVNIPVVQSHETTVVLQDAVGNRLTGKMKNGKLTIGRYSAKGAMLVIPNDAKLSGLHATLTKSGNSITIMDNQSTNGTKVNGSLISGPVPLSQNDSVTMGSNTYRVTWYS